MHFIYLLKIKYITNIKRQNTKKINSESKRRKICREIDINNVVFKSPK